MAEFFRKVEENWNKVQKKDEEAKAKGQLVGRYIREPYADGYAIYQIIRENKKSVRIRVVTGIGDDWHIPYWGVEVSIDKEYAIRNIAGRDFWSDLKKRKRA